jgi:hypothetical protein
VGFAWFWGLTAYFAGIFGNVFWDFCRSGENAGFFTALRSFRMTVIGAFGALCDLDFVAV